MTSPHTLTARSPEDLLAVVPLVLGFHPQESLVMLTTGKAGPSFHARVDLPPPHRRDEVEVSVAPLWLAAARHRATQLVFVVYTAHDDLALATAAEVERCFADVGVVSILRTHGGCWSPLEGGALGPSQSLDGATHPFAAQAVFEGTVTLASRGELAASLRPDPALVAEVAGSVGRHRAADRRGPGEETWVADLVARGSRHAPPTAEEVSRLVVDLQQVRLRDAAWSRITRPRSGELVPWWTEVLRGAPDELVAPPACLLAFTAWLSGHGALAWCALDRCVSVDPGYSAAQMVAELLHGAVPPSAWDDPDLERRPRGRPGAVVARLPVMGEDVAAQEFSRADRTRHREKIRRNLDVFERMLRDSAFDTDDPMTGLEIELNLVDDRGEPALKNAEALEAIADADFQTELGQFNVEINVPPARLREGGLTRFESNIRRSLNDAEERSSKVGAHMVQIGILPTLVDGHLNVSSISANPRYRLLSEQILAARGEDIVIDVRGDEQLRATADSIVPEAACTSTQFHLQTSPEDFAAHWNASQAIAGVQLALGANSPYLLGRQLWRETRIPLFEQATDTRSEELKTQGVRPRVWFGERWVTSVFDLFEENVRYFPALLPITDDEDPLEVLESGGTPALPELRLHNGTVYRWNRPVYDVAGGIPHLRVENRVLAAGPTVADTVANAAFYFGLVRRLASDERPLWSQMSFSAAEENFHTAARHGIDAQLYWPGVGQVPATELVLRRLLPMAREGLLAWGVETEVSDRLMGMIEGRCLAHTNGAEWYVRRTHAHEESGADRHEALRRSLLEYLERMHSNEPVHTWT